MLRSCWFQVLVIDESLLEHLSAWQLLLQLLPACMLSSITCVCAATLCCHPHEMAFVCNSPENALTQTSYSASTLSYASPVYSIISSMLC